MSKATAAQRDKRERRRRVRTDLTALLEARIREIDGYTVVQYEPQKGSLIVQHAHDGLWHIRLGVTRVEVTP